MELDPGAAALPTIRVDQTPDRAGWAVVTLVGRHSTPAAVRTLGSEVIDLLAAGVVMLSIDATRCDGLGAAGCHVLVDAARYTRQSGGCLAVSGLGRADLLSLRCYDQDHRVDVARDLG